MNLPDSHTATFGYDAAGRPETITIPTGTITTTYDIASGAVTSLESPGGVTLDFSYDGLLPTGVEWSGPIDGNVEYQYNNDFALSRIKVNGTTLADFDYDQDGLLTDAGDLHLSRNSSTGLIEGTALGLVTTDEDHNGFGELTARTATYNGTAFYETSYTRDQGGRITELVEVVRGDTTIWDYSYSTAGRLSQVMKDSTVAASFSYDSNRNRTQVVTPGGTQSE